MKILISAIIPLFIVSCTSRDLDYIIDLSGTWKFTVGDNPDWAAGSFEDKNWDNIQVPSSWEQQGYRNYNGYAWYRKKFNMSNIPEQEQLYLTLGRIDDADEVYLNGVLIGSYGSFPPHFESAFDVSRIYHIPQDLIRTYGKNTIAVRVYDSHLAGGIIDGKVGIGLNTGNRRLNSNDTRPAEPPDTKLPEQNGSNSIKRNAEQVSYFWESFLHHFSAMEVLACNNFDS
ncbi:MAG: hypothetical protein GVY19_03270 [Bacteroidetes bacterium]|jgi:sialate O-acetylesterase|nr:hypothetical protein [Bacteroidota bacterium]